jgi:D-glycero-D-manno-heptose 1,7-bisphosphate phosphatase
MTRAASLLQPICAKRAVFLDRDGVLNTAVVRNGKPYPPASVAELEVPADVIESTRRLHEAGFVLIGVTNQPDVARGTTQRHVVEEINAALRKAVPLDEMLVCYHDDADNCECRKPRPGLILDSAQTWGVDLAASFMIGDRWKDIEAGRRAGCRTVFLDRDYNERRPDPPADFSTTSFAQAAAWILKAGRSGETS